MMNKAINVLVFVFSCLAFFFFFSCRGQISDKPPFHLNPNMDFQPKKKAQKLSRDLPHDVVAYGETTDPYDVNRENYLQADSKKYTGKDIDNIYITSIPVQVDYRFVKRGQSRFNIYCATCHDQVGTSKSIIIQRGVGIPPPPVLASENLINMPDGEIFDVITQGRRNMPSYKTQIEVIDRWAIVAYVRALQKSRIKPFSSIPEKDRYLLYKENKTEK